MEKITKEYKKEIIVKETISLCDRCGCEIEDPNGFGKTYNRIKLQSDINYPEHGGWDSIYELCADCYDILEHIIAIECSNDTKRGSN